MNGPAAPTALIRRSGTAWALVVPSLWPATWIVVFVVGMVVAAATGFFGAADADETGGPPVWFLVAFALQGLTILLMLAMMALYLVDLFRNPSLPTMDSRILWLVLIVVVAPIGIAGYWWVHVRPSSDGFARRSSTSARTAP